MLKPLPWYVRMPLVIALVVGAFFAGKFTAPIEVQEVRSVEVRWKEKTSKTAREATAKTKIVYVDRIVLPNGTVKEKSETRETEATLIDATSLTERSGLARETAKTITISKPGWRVGVLKRSPKTSTRRSPRSFLSRWCFCTERSRASALRGSRISKPTNRRSRLRT